MNEITEFVYISRDNTIDLELREDGVAINITSLTRARIELHNKDDSEAAPVVVDSDIVPSAFDWTAQGADGILLITLGAVLAVEADYLVRLIIYDGANLNGLVWTHEQTSGCAGTKLVIRALATADAA